MPEKFYSAAYARAVSQQTKGIMLSNYHMVLFAALVISGCTEEAPYDPPRIFQISFSDSLSVATRGDSTHVLLMQRPYVYQGYIQPIPFDASSQDDLSDTLRIRFDFLYVGPSANPNRHPYYTITQSRDSLSLEFNLGALWKTSTDVPPPAYNMITHVRVIKPSGYYVSFESRLIP